VLSIYGAKERKPLDVFHTGNSGNDCIALAASPAFHPVAPIKEGCEDAGLGLDKHAKKPYILYAGGTLAARDSLAFNSVYRQR